MPTTTRLALALCAAALLATTPARAQDSLPALPDPTADSVPRYLQPFYERLAMRRGTGDGIFITRAELEHMGVNSVGAAVALRARREFRTRGRGRACRPLVYWNGIRLNERWDGRTGIADTSTDVMEGIEIYYADWMDLPLEYRRAECGVISLWARPGAEDQTAAGTMLKTLGLVALAILFFVLVGR